MSTQDLVPAKQLPSRAKRGAACKECYRRKRKCKHVQAPEQQKHGLEDGGTTMLFHVPTCDEMQLCRMFGESLQSLRIDHTWLRMMPCRLGHSTTVDHAMKALVKVTPYALRKDSEGLTNTLPDYLRSMEMLRRTIAQHERSLSDEVLMSVALLAVVDALLQSDDITAALRHWRALAEVLLARPESEDQSEISRAILYHIRNQTFHKPCSRGTASPFDHPRWYNLQPASSHTMPRDVARLRFLSNQLLIRLPGLIKIVRCLRNGVETEANMVRVNHLIEQLKELQDDTAESGMLHRVQVVKTSEAEDIEFVPVSFEFKDVLELEAAVLYWKSHMFLGNLQLKLSELSQSKIDTTQEILDVMERMGCNIMMAHQYAKARPQHTHSRGMVAMGTAWMSVWALWDHIPELKGIDRGRWRSWTLQKFNEAIKVWHIQACDQDMNQTSDLFAGGPLVGFLVRAYALA